MGTTSSVGWKPPTGYRLKYAAERPQPGHWVIDKEYPYTAERLYTTTECLDAVLTYLDELGIEETYGDTRLLIVPGSLAYTSGLITNYHMPGTTLILLVAALVGEDWRRIYQSAFKEGHRFLSYGDSRCCYHN